MEKAGSQPGREQTDAGLENVLLLTLITRKSPKNK